MLWFLSMSCARSSCVTWVPVRGFAALRAMPVLPENRMLKQVHLENAAEADYIFSMLMGEDVGPRRDFIEKNATYANIDA